MTDQKETIKWVVVKLGSSITTTRRGKLDKFQIAQFAKQVRFLKEKNIAVVIVMSGAVVCGENILRNTESKKGTTKQLAAGVGQAYIMNDLYKIFKDHNLLLAQILLIKKDLKNREKQEHLKNILQEATKTNVVPVLNENDVTDLHSFEGNDFLSSKIAQVLHADSLLLLTDVDGVYSKNRQILQSINTNSTDNLIFSMNKIKNGRVGGMQGKLKAAKIAANSGIQTIIANGKLKNILTRLILNQEKLGTRIIV